MTCFSCLLVNGLSVVSIFSLGGFFIVVELFEFSFDKEVKVGFIVIYDNDFSSNFKGIMKEVRSELVFKIIGW